jgi:hypothetical protein
VRKLGDIERILWGGIWVLALVEELDEDEMKMSVE